MRCRREGFSVRNSILIKLDLIYEERDVPTIVQFIKDTNKSNDGTVRSSHKNICRKLKLSVRHCGTLDIRWPHGLGFVRNYLAKIS